MHYIHKLSVCPLCHTPLQSGHHIENSTQLTLTSIRQAYLSGRSDYLNLTEQKAVELIFGSIPD